MLFQIYSNYTTSILKLYSNYTAFLYCTDLNVFINILLCFLFEVLVLLEIQHTQEDTAHSNTHLFFGVNFLFFHQSPQAVETPPLNHVNF